MKHLIKFCISLSFAFFLVIVIAGIIGIMVQCDHVETVNCFSFQYENSTAWSYVQTRCKECSKNLKTTLFRGSPSDNSYLSIIKTYSDAGEIVGGQYYTITATVTLGDYDHPESRLHCKVESDDITVYFSVEFKEEFEALISTIEEGDVITFYGEFYEEGCGFKNCDLILP